MTIFVTGATGVLGQPVIRGLIEKGHMVRALCRSSANRETLNRMGAIAEEVDLYDVSALADVFGDCHTVLHLATRIPPAKEMRKPDAWHENDRIRRNGTAAIVAAAEAAGTIETLLYPSVSFFYGNGGSAWMDATNAECEPASFLRSTLDAEACVHAFSEGGTHRRGIVLRFGGFYGPPSRESVQMLDLARRGLFMPVAEPEAYRSMIWIDDAARAVLDAVEEAPAGTYDVVEDAPSTQRQSAMALGVAVGRAGLRSMPRWLLHFALPEELRRVLARSHRISNGRFRELTGWRPAVSSQVDGWRLLERAAHGGTETRRHRSAGSGPSRSERSGPAGTMPSGFSATIEK